MPTANAEGYIKSEGGVGEVSARRVFRRLPDRHGSSAFAVGMLRAKKKYLIFAQAGPEKASGRGHSSLGP